MWEVVAAAGRTDDLVAWAIDNSQPSAQVYRSADRVVVIDPAGHGLSDPPEELVARPPHSWEFEPVERG